MVGITIAQGYSATLQEDNSIVKQGVQYEQFFKTWLSPKTTLKSMLHTYWISVCEFLSAVQTSSVQTALESSSDTGHADGHVERRGIDASEEATRDASNVICCNAPRASHRAAQASIHSQVASQETGVVNVRHADMAMC
jgi:hypothetical protein